MEIKIKGKKSEAVISTLGAQLMSFAKDGKEYIWNGDEKYWKGRSHFCSRLSADSEATRH